jgi:hypothetical protein
MAIRAGFLEYIEGSTNYDKLMEFLQERDFHQLFMIETDFRVLYILFQREKNNWILLNGNKEVSAIIDDESNHGIASFIFEEDETSADERITFMGSSKGELTFKFD